MVTLKQIVDCLRGHDSYALRDRVIYRTRDFREYSLSIDEIESWSVYPEMCFDVVEVRLKAGGTMIWFDYKDDLIAILRTAIPDAVVRPGPLP